MVPAAFELAFCLFARPWRTRGSQGLIRACRPNACWNADAEQEGGYHPPRLESSVACSKVTICLSSASSPPGWAAQGGAWRLKDLLQVLHHCRRPLVNHNHLCSSFSALRWFACALPHKTRTKRGDVCGLYPLPHLCLSSSGPWPSLFFPCSWVSEAEIAFLLSRKSWAPISQMGFNA